MKLAISYDQENQTVFQHFGHTEQFLTYDVTGAALSAPITLPTNGSGHGALATFLKEQGVCVVICGGIGDGAIQALKAAGIQVYSGVSGNAEQAAQAFAAGTLEQKDCPTCAGHDHAHGACGGHDHHSCQGTCHHGEKC
ncbi:MAG: NifB/NifX family molybdenum-iron cluster-binding protein [Eubacteriales bacterium]|nr:NifB/NifX family molybdenum-iron cluster-binding protein [Eubacteriales bacterium]